jgi:transposase
MARTRELTPEIADQIATTLALGGHFELACKAAAVPLATALAWRQRGAQANEDDTEDEPYRSFYELAAEAEAKSESHLIVYIEKAGRSDWRAAAWLLERRHRSRWAADLPPAGGTPGGVKIEIVYAADPAAEPGPGST